MSADQNKGKNANAPGKPSAATEQPALTPEQYREMLNAICEAQILFIEEPGRPAFDRLLQYALELSGSRFGFIGEILYDDSGKPYLRERAAYLSYADAARRAAEDIPPRSILEIHSFDNLIGSVVNRAVPVITNDAMHDPGTGTPPPGLPNLHTFLGLPLFQFDEVVGVIALANNPKGYNNALCEALEPISMFSASMMLTSRNFSVRQQAENALYDSERRQRLLFENSRDALISLTPPDWKFALVNGATEQLFGAKSKSKFSGISFAEVSPPRQPDGRPSAERARVLIASAMREGSGAFEWEFLRFDDTPFFASVLLTRTGAGGTQALQVTVRDITAARQARMDLERESQKNELLLRIASDGVHILDSTGQLVLMSDSFCHMLGYQRDEMLNMHVSQWDTKWSDTDLRERVSQLLQQGATFETLHRRKDGRQIDVEVSARKVMLDGKEMLYCSSRDITERKVAEKSIIRHANYDSLTRLPNRSLFRDRLEQEVKKSHRSGWPMALMLIDLDRFKEVNDTLGHDKGDMLLIEAARRVTECVRETDTVARLGGDEFTVILSELDDTKHVDHIVRKIIKRLAAPFLLGDDQAFVSASVGITLYPHDSTDLEALLKNADQAMYQAKNQGRNRFCFFTAALQDAAQKRMRMINDMRSALDGEQFRVHYQPIVELATGSIHKAEALIRWQHPVQGMISPGEFIPLAEETGMIVEIGDWIFQHSMRQCQQWRASHHPGFQISVNRSPAQFHHDLSQSKEWIRYLQSIDLPGHGLVIEITEGLLLNVEGGIQEKLLAFRDAGVQVAIDDFGTGYSSLSYLNKLDIDYLKIDQSFVRNLGSSPSDMALCEAIIIMAHKLGLKTIAEGVSTETQRDILARAGCDYAQGFLYSRPVPADEFEKLLKGSPIPANP